MNSMKRQKYMTLKDELLRSVDAQYATGEEWRNNSRKNEEAAVHRSEKTPGSKYSSTSGLSPRGHLERQAEFHASTQDEA